ncbi:SRPBCC family protein [Lysobacter sp. Root690]|uniref:SRPBCC family protein n=1 Tax=Lysobacter sp. Root690 TaxID=1736588 RepID=UPI0006F7BC46|nr:SRPBCC family protein [Lysobacter sp. Root690]KRB08012.1 ATPase [Lysobacter sp. Root690]
MSPKPSGHLHGNDLMITRSFQATFDDVWESVTKPEKTALWFGGWEGEAGVGNVIRLQLIHEKGRPWSNVKIEACEAPHRLVVTMKDDYGDWRIELTLMQVGSTTELRFVQPLSDRELVGDVGPGWEYYLDKLVAAREGKPSPSFDDYYPAQKAHYLEGT